MKLQLTYSDLAPLAVHAVFLRGEHLALSVSEMEQWGVSWEEMECYIVPVSIQSTEPAGLFVIFKDPSKIPTDDLTGAYSRISDKLFIPVNAAIIPCLSIQELDSMLLWDMQVFHPAIGLIGFEKKDKLDINSLFEYTEPIISDWSHAHPGLSDKPAFTEINVVQPSTQALMNSIQNDIGQKPLENIGIDKGAGAGLLGRVFDTLSYYALKGIFSMTSMIEKPDSGAGSSATNINNEKGVFGRLQHWLRENIEGLEEKRKDEINRLLSLFDENTNEALQYAIPLDSPYLNRGTERSSAVLTKRSLNFNLGLLGGGRAVDGWDIGNNYHTLRSKYLAAAEKQIREGDFKKAAYIYAHLLGDYSAAANALEQGKMFRDAAALYKDHLKNIPAAAECLERGGLYLESIALYKELEKHEKTGDLYGLVNQREKAVLYYEKHIAIKEANSDYLDAGRVMHEKLEQQEKAMDLWLQGWKNAYQYEACLQKYFSVILNAKTGETENKIREVYAAHTPRHKKAPFLNILEYVNSNTDQVGITDTTKEIAFEIVHDEVESGNIQLLHSLKKFLPQDKLISSDASRYISQVRSRIEVIQNPKVFHLDQTIKWMRGTWHRNQFLIIGIKNGNIQMARGNWYNNTEYYSWSNQVESNTRFSLVDTPYESNHVLLHTSGGIPATRKNLPKNKYFAESLIVYCPIWLHKGSAQFCMNNDQTIARLETTDRHTTLHTYSIDGDLKKSTHCYGEDPGQLSYGANPVASMMSHEGYYYTFYEKVFVSIATNGLSTSYDYKTAIRSFAAAFAYHSSWLVISCNAGCILLSANKGILTRKGEYFAEKLIPVIISFISSDRFVMVEKTKAHLFEIRNEEAIELNQYDTHHRIIAALPTSGRNQFGIIEESGRVTLCEIAS